MFDFIKKLFVTIENYILNWLFIKLLAKKSKNRIPRTGEEGKKENSFTIYLCEEGIPYAYAEKYDEKKELLSILCLDARGNQFSVEDEIKLNQIHLSDLQISHYYGLYEINHHNGYWYLAHYITKWPYINIKISVYFSKASQHFFNKKELVTKKRVELLKIMIEHQIVQDVEKRNYWINSSSKGITTFTLMTLLYTEKWIKHPNSDKKKRKLELYLQSLVQSGDLVEEKGMYIVQGRALETFEKYEESAKRHGDSVRIQTWIAILTIIIALSEAKNAGMLSPIFQFLHDLLYPIYLAVYDFLIMIIYYLFF